MIKLLNKMIDPMPCQCQEMKAELCSAAEDLKRFKQSFISPQERHFSAVVNVSLTFCIFLLSHQAHMTTAALATLKALANIQRETL